MWYPGIRDERKWRQREEMGGKISPTRARIFRNGVFALSKVKNGPKRKECFFSVPNASEVSLGGSSTINF